MITLAACGVALAVGVGAALTGSSSVRTAGLYQYERLSVGGAVYHYRVYVPSSRRAGFAVPLVVVLHGCSTTADQQAAVSGYDPIAEQSRFLVLYPDVDPVDQANGRCWKGIWDPGAEGRGRGDSSAIAEMTKTVIGRWHVDRARVYVIGISAGGFESAILGADYPDLYAAIGIHSGAAYLGCAQNASSADTNMLAHAALAAMDYRARVMPVIVFHGDEDGTIPLSCGQQALTQWLITDGVIRQHQHRAALPSAPTEVRRAIVAGGHSYTVRSYADRLGCPIAQLWTVHGMGHYWSGGSANPALARYSDPRGPSAAAASWAFFSQLRLSTGPPCSGSAH